MSKAMTELEFVFIDDCQFIDTVIPGSFVVKKIYG